MPHAKQPLRDDGEFIVGRIESIGSQRQPVGARRSDLRGSTSEDNSLIDRILGGNMACLVCREDVERIEGLGYPGLVSAAIPSYDREDATFYNSSHIRDCLEAAHRRKSSGSFSQRPSSIDSDNMTFETCIATESFVRVFDIGTGRVIEEVLIAGGARMPSQVPLLDTHSRSTVHDVLGRMTSFRREGTKWRGRGEFTPGVPDAATAFAKVAAGHITDVSVGYRVLKCEVVQPGTSKKINGRTWTALDVPLRIALEWRVFEVSLCPIGADEDAKIRTEDKVRNHTKSEAGSGAGKSATAPDFDEARHQFLLQVIRQSEVIWPESLVEWHQKGYELVGKASPIWNHPRYPDRCVYSPSEVLKLVEQQGPK